MDICVLGVPAASESAKKLAKALGCHAYIDQWAALKKKDAVINYGSTYIPGYWDYKNIINHPLAVARCIDKVKTLETLWAAGVRVPGFSTDKKDVSKHWEIVVVRSDVRAAKNKGMDYWYRRDKKRLPEAPLYTQYFEHKKEFRVVVLKGKIVDVYQKVVENDEWSFYSVKHTSMKKMKDQCILAADALKIDYVGFDVVYNNANDFVILEANSAPILTPETVEAFKQLLGK